MDVYKMHIKNLLDEEKRKGVDLCEKFAVDLYNSDALIIPSVDLCVTTRCNLKCVNCLHCIPEYSKNGVNQRDVPSAALKKDIAKLSQTADYILRIVILGGEALLHKDLAEIIRFCGSLPNVGVIRIPTNATIMPSDDVFDAIKQTSSFIGVNHYVGVYNTISEKIDAKALELGVHNGVQVEFQRTWDEFLPPDGTIIHSAVEAENAYASCRCWHCNFLLDGELTVCATDYHSKKLGLIPKGCDAADSIQIHDFDREVLRQKLKEFYGKRVFRCCFYCSLPDNAHKKVPAGIQPGGYKKEARGRAYFVGGQLETLYACILNYHLKGAAYLYVVKSVRVDKQKLVERFNIHGETRIGFAYDVVYISERCEYPGFLPLLAEDAKERRILLNDACKLCREISGRYSKEELPDLCARLNEVFEYKHSESMRHLILMNDGPSHISKLVTALKNKGDVYVKSFPGREMTAETAELNGVTAIKGDIPFELVFLNIMARGQEVELWEGNGNKSERRIADYFN